MGVCPTSGVPQFVGPYADRLEQSYRGTSSDVAKAVLCDSVVSEAEAAEANESLRNCLEDAGLINIEIGSFGQLSVEFPPGTDAATASVFDAREQRCETDSGWYPIIPLYNDMRTNPDKVDLDPYIADCLVRYGARPEGYTDADLDEEFMHDNPLADIPHDVFEKCVYDPLHN